MTHTDVNITERQIRRPTGLPDREVEENPLENHLQCDDDLVLLEWRCMIIDRHGKDVWSSVYLEPAPNFA